MSRSKIHTFTDNKTLVLNFWIRKLTKKDSQHNATIPNLSSDTLSSRRVTHCQTGSPVHCTARLWNRTGSSYLHSTHTRFRMKYITCECMWIEKIRKKIYGRATEAWVDEGWNGVASQQYVPEDSYCILSYCIWRPFRSCWLGRNWEDSNFDLSNNWFDIKIKYRRKARFIDTVVCFFSR